ncbi:hypothetical protein FACS189427_13830 [Planctomycetales bacterium]|nr:hypothetical protein FACS189427_13830 [Planctomycetales bacterium]
MGLRQDFETVVQKFKTDLITALNQTNVLNKNKMTDFAALYNQKMVNLQTDFLHRVAESSVGKIRVEFRQPNPKEFCDFGTITFVRFGTDGAVYVGLTFITWGTVQTSPWRLFWTTKTAGTVSLAAWLAATLGISTRLATMLLADNIAFTALTAVYFAYYSVWRRRIRKQLINDFDEAILPKLRDWTDKIIQTAE